MTIRSSRSFYQVRYERDRAMKKFFRTVFAICIVAFNAFALLGVATFTKYVSPPVRLQTQKVEIPVEVEKPEPSQAQLEQVCLEQGAPRVIFRALLRQENSSRISKHAKHCEMQSAFWLKAATEQANRLLKQGKIQRWEWEEQRDAMRCSYGPLQVAGWHAPNYDRMWSDLVSDSEINAFVGCKYWRRDCFDKAKGDLPQRLYQSFKCYNGADAYATEATAYVLNIAAKELLERDL